MSQRTKHLVFSRGFPGFNGAVARQIYRVVYLKNFIRPHATCITVHLIFLVFLEPQPEKEVLDLTIARRIVKEGEPSSCACPSNVAIAFLCIAN